jgi:hypothetical protein
MRLLAADFNPITRPDRWIAVGLGLAFAFLYLLVPMRVVSYDALAYANSVLFGIPRQVFHPHHVLYAPINLLLFNLLRLFNPALNPLQSMGWLNSFAGVTTLGLIYLLIRRLGQSRLAALLLTVLLGSSKGFFTYSTMAEVVMPMCLGIVGVLYLALSYQRSKQWQIWLLGGLYGLIMLFHQNALLYTPIILAAALWHVEARQRLSAVLRFLAAASGLSIIGYLLVLNLGLGIHSPAEWLNFMVSDFRVGGWGKGTIAQIPQGWNYFLASGFHGFLIAEPTPDELGWVRWGMIATWLVVLGALVGFIRGVCKGEGWWIVLLINLLLVIGFFSWWVYDCRDSWVLPYLLLIILIAGALPARKSWFWGLPLAAIIVVTALGNWNLHFQYFTNPGNDLAGRIAKQLAPEAQNHKVFVFTVDGSLMERLRMEGVSTSLWGNSDMQDQNIQRLKQLYNFISEKGGKLLVDDDIYCQFDELIKPYLGANMQGRISQSFLNASKEIESVSTDYREIVLWRIL